MRPALILLILALASQSGFAQDRQKLRDARAVAESMIRPSGPVRADPSTGYTPTAWRPQRDLAGTYADYADRHRFTQYTRGWYSPYRYLCHPFSRAWRYPCW